MHPATRRFRSRARHIPNLSPARCYLAIALRITRLSALFPSSDSFAVRSVAADCEMVSRRRCRSICIPLRAASRFSRLFRHSPGYETDSVNERDACREIATSGWLRVQRHAFPGESEPRWNFLNRSNLLRIASTTCDVLLLLLFHSRVNYAVSIRDTSPMLRSFH